MIDPFVGDGDNLASGSGQRRASTTDGVVGTVRRCEISSSISSPCDDRIVSLSEARSLRSRSSRSWRLWDGYEDWKII